MNLPIGAVQGPDYFGQEDLLLACIAPALSRAGRGQGLIGARRFGRTSTLLHLQYLVDPLTVGEDGWLRCWDQLLRDRGLDVGSLWIGDAESLASHLQERQAVLPVYLTLSSVHDDRSLLEALRDALVATLRDVSDRPFVASAFACLNAPLQESVRNAAELLEHVLQALREEHGRSSEPPILWLLIDEAGPLVTGALKEGDRHWSLPFFGLWRDALDFQSLPRRRSCFNSTLSLSPVVLDLAAEHNSGETYNFASSLLTRHDWMALPLWSQEMIIRFLRLHGSPLLSQQAQIWRALGGIPEGPKRLINAGRQREIELEEELDQFVHAQTTRQTMAHWMQDLGRERYQLLFEPRSGSSAHLAQLERLGLLVKDGRGGYQAPPRLLGSWATRPSTGGASNLQLCFAIPDLPNLEPGDRQVLHLGSGQAGAITLVDMVGDRQPALSATETWGISGREFIALYAMAVAGMCEPPGVSVDVFDGLVRYLHGSFPWLWELVGPQLGEEPQPWAKIISTARQKIGPAASWFLTPGRGHSSPYGLGGDLPVCLVPYVLRRGSDGLQLRTLQGEALSASWRALEVRYPELPEVLAQTWTAGLRRLEQLLSNLFDSDELLRFLASHEPTRALVQDLPGPGTPPSQLAHLVTAKLDQRGLLRRSLFTALRQARPARIDQIAQVERCFLLSTPRS